MIDIKFHKIRLHPLLQTGNLAILNHVTNMAACNWLLLWPTHWKMTIFLYISTFILFFIIIEKGGGHEID